MGSTGMNGIAIIVLIDADEDGSGAEISRMPRYQKRCSGDVPRLQYSVPCRGMVVRGQDTLIPGTLHHFITSIFQH